MIKCKIRLRTKFDHSPLIFKETYMSPITPQDQERLNEDFKNLNGKEKAELLLSSIFGMKLTKENLDMIKTGVAEYLDWHEKQHPSFDKCDDCEFVRQNIGMWKAIEYWHTHYQTIINAKK